MVFRKIMSFSFHNMPVFFLSSSCWLLLLLYVACRIFFPWACSSDTKLWMFNGWNKGMHKQRELKWEANRHMEKWRRRKAPKAMSLFLRFPLSVVLLVSYCLFYGFTLISNMCCARTLRCCFAFCLSACVSKWMLIFLRVQLFICYVILLFFYIFCSLLCRSFFALFCCSSFDLSLGWFMCCFCLVFVLSLWFVAAHLFMGNTFLLHSVSVISLHIYCQIVCTTWDSLEFP